MSSTPVRRIRARQRSRDDRPAARRAIVESAPVSQKPEAKSGMPRFGRAEWQLVVAYAVTAGVVFVIAVVVPAVMRIVRNF